MTEKNQKMNPNKVRSMYLPVWGAIFIAVCSIFYVTYKSWSNKLNLEKWKDYEECGV